MIRSTMEATIPIQLQSSIPIPHLTLRSAEAMSESGGGGCINSSLLLCNTTWSNGTMFDISATSTFPPDPRYGIAVTTLLATLAGITSFCTTVGNIMVVISFMLEKGIRQPSNYLIASLAVTDIFIGSLSMPFYTLYLLKKYWPLPKITCDLWLSMDYTVCLVSQYTVFLITLDRFCSVKVPAKYRNWRTKNKIKAMIAVTWFIPAVIFFTSIMGWSSFVKTSTRGRGLCYAAFQENQLFSAILVICYYWVTLIIMIVLYIGIYRVALALHVKSRETKKRIKQLSQNTAADSAEREKERLLSSTDTPGITPSTNTDSSQESSKRSRDETMHSNNGTSGHNHQPSDKVKPTIPALTLTIQETKQNGSSNHVLRLPVSVQDLDSPVWKPRNSLPTSSIHWNAFTGDTFHTVDSESAKDESTYNASRSPSLRKAKRQTSKKRNSERRNTNTVDDKDDTSSESSDLERPPRVLNQLSTLVASLTPNAVRMRQASPQAQHSKQVTIKRKNKSENRARKALRTITFILGAFVVCWTPYHVIVLVDSFCKTCTKNNFYWRMYEFSYWLCYMNSPLNPFCYALSNPQFKRSFIKIIKLEYMRECWQKVTRDY